MIERQFPFATQDHWAQGPMNTEDFGKIGWAHFVGLKEHLQGFAAGHRDRLARPVR